jgi:hypothetical protein
MSTDEVISGVIGEIVSIMMRTPEASREEIISAYISMWKDMGEPGVEYLRISKVNTRHNNVEAPCFAIAKYLKDLLYTALSVDCDKEILETISLN